MKLVVISRTGERSQVLHSLKNNTTVSYSVTNKPTVFQCFKPADTVKLYSQKEQELQNWKNMLTWTQNFVHIFLTWNC